LQLVEAKAVAAGYPLRGRLQVAGAAYAQGAATGAIPRPGTVWPDSRLAALLGLARGDTVEVGAQAFTITRILTAEPDRGADLFSIAPRLLMNLADLPATRLVQPGSRVKHRLLIAAAPVRLAALRVDLGARLTPAQRLYGVSDARPRLRTALRRAARFLGLAGLVSVLLAGLALAIAARAHAARQFDAVAVLRCLGASQGTVLRLYALELAVLGLLASLVGGALGVGVQALLGAMIAGVVSAGLPGPAWINLIQGPVVAIAVLVGFAVPPLARLRTVPPARVLRRELGPPPAQAWRAYALAGAVTIGLIVWQAGDLTLATWVLGAASIVAAGLFGAAFALIKMLGFVAGHAAIAWRYGLANISRHAATSVAHCVAIGLGLMLLLLLTVVRRDLVAQWQARIPASAPNYFLVNVQADEADALDALLTRRGVSSAGLYPMVRARLTAINGHPVHPDDYRQVRAQGLARHTFNLSWSTSLAPDNRLLAGRWWRPSDHGKPLLSVERGLSEALGFGLGDTLRFAIAGRVLEARIASVRSVQWDSLRPNFFFLAAPGLLADYPATYMTAVHLADNRRALLGDLLKRFPSVTVLDVNALLGKLRQIMDHAARGVQYVLTLTLAAGLLVLLAAVQVTLHERRYETAVLRTLGAGRGRLLAGLVIEFATLGALAGLLAAPGASITAGLLAGRVLGIDYQPTPWLWFIAILGGAVCVAAAGVVGTRRVLDQPPIATLRAAGG